MKVSMHWIILLTCFSICSVLPSYGQTNHSKLILIKGNLTNHPVIHHKIGIVIDGDTMANTIDNKGNFKINTPNKVGFSRPALATLIYPFDGLKEQVKKNKIIHFFFLDADTINILIDPKQEIIETYGGYENTVNAAFSKLDEQYRSDIQSTTYTTTQEAIDSLSRTYYMQVLDMATKYKNSLSTYNRLFSLLRPTAFPLRDKIYTAIDALDRNYFTLKELEEINSSYTAFVKKNTDKENDTLWPDLQYTPYESPNFDKLRLSYDYILIDIWATWCAPCIQQHPYIKKLAAKYAANDRFKIIGVALQCKQSDWEKHLTTHPTNYFNYWLDKKQAEMLTHQIKITEVPRYVLLRPSDNILVEKRIPFDKIEVILEKYNIK